MNTVLMLYDRTTCILYIYGDCPPDRVEVWVEVQRPVILLEPKL